jgi:MtrB/PioB family decaheme-associated outer membrane protein
MKPRLLAILVANLFIGAPLAFAAEGDMRYTGSIGLGYQGSTVDSDDPSKLNEYRDLQPGALSNFELKGRGDRSYLDVFGENFGRDDVYVDMRGGRYGTLKYQLYGNELRHNFGSGPGARSPYTSGIGTSTLTGTFPSTNVATWATFDHSYERRDWGGNFEYSGGSPWYVRADGNEVTRKGTNVFAAAQGTSPGNGFVDLPAPIDYTTRNLSLEGGYSSKRGHFAVSFMQSNFYNDNERLNFSNGFFSPANPFNYDTAVLPPDNELRRIAANGNLRQLPWTSTLAGRLTYSKLTNNVAVLPTILSTGSTNPATASSSPTFDGEIVKSTAALSLSSHPLRDLDTKLYYNWAKEDNNSTHLTFSPTAASGLQCSGGPCTPEPFEYRKNNVGVEAGWRVTRGNKLTAGYDYSDTERERIDFVRNIDNRYSLEWRNSSLDTLVGRLKYQFLDRNSTYDLPASAAVINPMEPFVRKFDLANVNQNLAKLVLDYSPRPLFDLGFEAIYKKNDYKDTQLGRTDDIRQEYYASFAYGDPKSVRFIVFGDIELVEFNSSHRVGGGTPVTSDPSQPPNPLPPATATTYNWKAKNKDTSWMVGLGADWAAMPRLTFKASAIYAETDGSVDFAAVASGGVTPVVPVNGTSSSLLPIVNSDDTKRTSLNLKAVYRVDRHWELTGGYAYEKYEYKDIGYDGFAYVAGAGASASYMTGQYAFQPYTANIFYAMGTYKF